MTDEEYQIRRKYENRNLMQELEWVSHYPPSGMSNQDRDFIKWLAMTAYDKIKELQTYESAFEDIIRIGGWWLVGNDSRIYSMNVPMNWPPTGTQKVEFFKMPDPQEPKEET